MGKMLLFYIPCQNKAQAKKIAGGLLDKRLIACANFFPIESMYWWKNKIEQDKEVVIIAKTLARNHDKATIARTYDKIKKEVLKLHSYSKPCIIALEVDKVNKEYESYLKQELEGWIWKKFLVGGTK